MRSRIFNLNGKERTAKMARARYITGSRTNCNTAQKGERTSANTERSLLVGHQRQNSRVERMAPVLAMMDCGVNGAAVRRCRDEGTKQEDAVNARARARAHDVQVPSVAPARMKERPSVSALERRADANDSTIATDETKG
jgi:hypothetical protein